MGNAASVVVGLMPNGTLPPVDPEAEAAASAAFFDTLELGDDPVLCPRAIVRELIALVRAGGAEPRLYLAEGAAAVAVRAKKRAPAQAAASPAAHAGPAAPRRREATNLPCGACPV